MNDLEKLKSIFDELGVEYKLKEILPINNYPHNQELIIASPNLFYTEFNFLDGKFIDFGCYE